MRGIYFHAIAVGQILAIAGALAGTANGSAQQPAASQNSVSGQNGGRWRGGGDFPAGGRGVLGAVTEVTPEHYTIKTDAGEVYTVHYSVNTRIVKQAAGRGRGQGSQGQGGQGQGGSGQGQAQGSAGRERGDGERAVPETIKPTDIKVGDIITAAGEMDAAGKSIGAIFIAQVDPERAKQMREMQANYGKTWLAGRITAIDGTNITIEGTVDHASHVISVDENTSFRERRDSITMADIHAGEQLRADGAMKDGAFRATQIVAMEPQNRDRTAGGNAGGNMPPAAPKPQ
jgi:Domain of unknown function (DUF5666)